MGIEPTSTAWEAVVLPMNYIRVFCLLMYSTKICLKSQATKKDSYLVTRPNTLWQECDFE